MLIIHCGRITMGLRSAATKLESLARVRTDSTDTGEMMSALAEIADSLFREFSHLHERLDRLEAALKRQEIPPDPPTAKT